MLALDKILSLMEVATAIANRLDREQECNPHSPEIVYEILERWIRQPLIAAQSELSAIAHHRPPDLEVCQLTADMLARLLAY